MSTQLPGAVLVLAFSIVTLAVVLAGIERGRSRRHARGYHQHARGGHLHQIASTSSKRAAADPRLAGESSPAAPRGQGTRRNVEEEVVGGVDDGVVPGPGDGRIPGPADLPGQRLEILVHNISHKDMVLSLRRTWRAMKTSSPQQQPTISNVIDSVDTALARPKFSQFKASSELILNKLLEIRAAGQSEPPPAVCPVYRRWEPDLWSEKSAAPRESVSVGFDLDDTPIPIFDLSGYRIRSADLGRLAPATGLQNSWSLLPRAVSRRDSSGFFLAGSSGGRGGGGSVRSYPSQDSERKRLQRQQLDGSGGGGALEAAGNGGGGEREAFICGVYFPLLSVLMPKWIEQLAGSGDDVDSSKTVLLVSGVGQPRNEEHRLEDNSTEVTAILMEIFLRRHYPDVRVVRVHSDTNIFRYDDNIRFVKTELLPLLNAERSRMSDKYGGDWQDMMHITMSFADGSPARISSINTALRTFRPSFIHIWELKTFWHEKAICEDDVEMHTFEDIDMQPPIPASEVDALTGLVIAEMQRLRGDLERILAAPPRGGVIGGDARDDLASFWLRKTKKPVLAVLLVQKKGGQPQLYRGTNMEVSMPTGSLCAERNVIGSALTADLSLLRRDIKAVAVLSVARLGRSSDATATTFEAKKTAATDGNEVPSPGFAVDGGGGGGGGGGRQGWGLSAGLGSAGTSVVGSSVGSRVPSPLTLTPAMKASPKCLPGVKDGGGGGAEDEERLEGVCEALRAVATVEDAWATTAAAAADAPPTPPQMPDFFLASSHQPNSESRSNSVIDRRGGSHQRWQQQQQEEEVAPSGGNLRERSGSCTDELLAAGRATPEEAFGLSGDGHGGGRGGGAGGSGGTGREGAAEGAPLARSQVPRSQSLDLSTAGARVDRRGAVATEEELARRKVLRRTKVVRSIASTPNRGAGSGSIGGGGWDRSTPQDGSRSCAGGNGGAGIYSNNDYKGVSSGGNNNRTSRSSVVAHIPAETLCSNPLKPCGACMEWLKKIAEVNPDFKIITFTDSHCGGVYIEDVAQIP